MADSVVKVSGFKLWIHHTRIKKVMAPKQWAVDLPESSDPVDGLKWLF